MKVAFATMVGAFFFVAAQPTLAQDRCGCERQLQAARCGNDQICQGNAMSRYHMCMQACYPQSGSPGISR